MKLNKMETLVNLAERVVIALETLATMVTDLKDIRRALDNIDETIYNDGVDQASSIHPEEFSVHNDNQNEN